GVRSPPVVRDCGPAEDAPARLIETMSGGTQEMRLADAGRSADENGRVSSEAAGESVDFLPATEYQRRRGSGRSGHTRGRFGRRKSLRVRCVEALGGLEPELCSRRSVAVIGADGEVALAGFRARANERDSR